MGKTFQASDGASKNITEMTEMTEMLDASRIIFRKTTVSSPCMENTCTNSNPRRHIDYFMVGECVRFLFTSCSTFYLLIKV